ncbi:hypothetical protein CH333_06430 [candidate division WOR-3 bacterium JGI_Cruoil_03_44_89]|uniref:Uncharacterized protein n=1 Tax=candidate division WOR-3 bacterium JGI_Cruoil_03_44_89 TaxID=1973748 RepID=A0A235BSE2_UNCW3|nr:MAG: hypothetical protein CH333_06430 [candidate division WOR-3 bacterium JGI_Cruoil_03_44_89]
MKHFKDIWSTILNVLIPFLLFIIIPLITRANFKRLMRKAKENLLELRKYIPGDVYMTENGLPHFKGKYGNHGIVISFERKKNESRANMRITMRISSGLSVKIYGKRLVRQKAGIKTGVSDIDERYTVISSNPEMAKSLILSISRDDTSALKDFLKEGIVIGGKSITLLKRNAGTKDTQSKKLLSVLEVTGRLARTTERLSPPKNYQS